MAIYKLKESIGATQRTLKDYNFFQKLFRKDESQDGFEFTFPGDNNHFWLPKNVVEKYFQRLEPEDIPNPFSEKGK